MTETALENTDSYRSRMMTEYWQLKDKYEKLRKMNIQREAGTLGFEPKCDVCLLERQEEIMREYLRVLEIRAEIEGVSL